MYSTLKRTTKYAIDHLLMPDLGKKLSCAVSGGADSMCMLHIFEKISADYGFSVDVLHFNHQLRGEESDRDEAFVHHYCAEHGLNLTVGTPENALDGSENSAREARYAFFEKNASLVATAHNADDNAETVLANLARGTGATGLRGIAAKMTRESGLTVIRPIMCLTRAEIIQYLEYNDIPHMEDSSNSDTGYSRNLIRASVMPVLREINPKIAAHALATSESLAEDDRCLNALAEAFLRNCGFAAKNPRISRREFNALPTAIASRVVIAAAEIFGVKLFREHVRDVLALSRGGKGGLTLTLPKGMMVKIEREYLEFLISS